MNPYLPVAPPLSPDVDLKDLLRPALESSLKAIVQQYNLLTYIDYPERLPDAKALRRDMKQKGFGDFDEVRAALWVLGHSYELLPFPLTPEAGDFSKIHFLVNTGSVIEAVMQSISRDVGALYQQLLGESAAMVNLRKVTSNPAYYSDMTDEHRRLYLLGQITVTLSDYRDLFRREPVLMRQDLVRERRHAALIVLERNLHARKGADGERSRFEHREEGGAEVPFSFSETVRGHDPVIALAEKAPRRAIESPRWKAYEAESKEPFNWGMVLQVFGAEMVIRILLRRHDYRQLLSMVESDSINDPSDLRFCLRALEKIQENNDLQPMKEPDHSSLMRFLKNKLAIVDR